MESISKSLLKFIFKKSQAPDISQEAGLVIGRPGFEPHGIAQPSILILLLPFFTRPHPLFHLQGLLILISP